ncbi:hypothetical protein AAG906_026308 [Vitis piasezkii]
MSDTFEALPEVHFLHAIYHFKAQEVKNPMLQTRCEITLLLRNDFAAFLHSAVEFPLKFLDTLEAEHCKLKDHFAAVINFVDYSLNQGAPAGHESADTPIGHESNGAVAGDGTTLHEEAMNFMSYVAEVSRGWDEPNARNMGRMTSQPNAKGEMYILNDGIDMRTKFAAMERRLEELEMKNMQEVQAISQTPFTWWMSVLPFQPRGKCLVIATPTIPIGGPSKFLLKPQLPYLLNKKMDEVQNDLSQKIDNLQDSISRFANLNKVQEKENFPSQPYQNSKGIHEVEAQEGESSMVKEVETVITLRSGKEVDLPTCKLEHKVESEIEKENREEIKGKKREKHREI